MRVRSGASSAVVRGRTSSASSSACMRETAGEPGPGRGAAECSTAPRDERRLSGEMTPATSPPTVAVRRNGSCAFRASSEGMSSASTSSGGFAESVYARVGAGGRRGGQPLASSARTWSAASDKRQSSLPHALSVSMLSVRKRPAVWSAAVRGERASFSASTPRTCGSATLGANCSPRSPASPVRALAYPTPRRLAERLSTHSMRLASTTIRAISRLTSASPTSVSLIASGVGEKTPAGANPTIVYCFSQDQSFQCSFLQWGRYSQDKQASPLPLYVPCLLYTSPSPRD